MAENKVIKYLDDSGLKVLWDKISNTYLRQRDVIAALTEYGEGKIIVDQDHTFVQKGTFDAETSRLAEWIENVEAAQGTNIDNDTIINTEGILKTNILLHNDKDNHVLSLVTGADNGKGTTLSSWDYTEFYNEAVKDGILDSVSLVVIPEDESVEDSGQTAGTYLKFTFNTSSGKNPIYVDVDDLIDVYEGSTYISIEKSGGNSDKDPDTVSISLKEAELVQFLKSDQALGIESIVNRVAANEDAIKSIQDAFDRINLNELKEAVETLQSKVGEIEETLKTVPTTPITEQEINELE